MENYLLGRRFIKVRNKFSNKNQNSGEKNRKNKRFSEKEDKKSSDDVGMFYFAHDKFPNYFKSITRIMKDIADGRIMKIAEVVQTFETLLSLGKMRKKKVNCANLGTYLESMDWWDASKIITLVLPFIARRVLESSHVFKKPLKILKKAEKKILTLSRYQVSILLSLMFFGLIPFQASDQIPLINDFTIW